MTTTTHLASQAMPAREIDRKTRMRIAANLRLVKAKMEFPTDAAMGRKIGIGRDAVNRALKGEKTVGLDFLLSVHRRLHVSLDWLVENEPGEKWYDPDTAPRGPT